MKKIKRVTSVILLLLMIFNLTFVSLAETGPQSTPGKDEVVYASLSSTGSLENLQVVNIFKGGSVVDFGDYSSVKILNTTDEIVLEDGVVSFTSDSEKVYYQGTLENKDLPFHVQVDYFLDGKKIEPHLLAGASGSLKIEIIVEKNGAVETSFYENYALQTTITLDSQKCQNIVASHASIVNVGTDKQLLYTSLPGEGLQAEITTDVTDFSMEEISINGLPLSLDFSVDTDALFSNMEELLDGIDAIAEGANDLETGSVAALDGSKSLKDGSYALSAGFASLEQGILELESGISSAQEGLLVLNSHSSSLTSGSKDILDALTSLSLALNELTNVQSLDSLVSSNQAMIQGLTSQVGDLKVLLEQAKDDPSASEQTKALELQIENLQQTIQLLEANNQAHGSVEAYVTQVSSSLSLLKKGVDDLLANYKVFHGSLLAYCQGVSSLSEGYDQLLLGIRNIVTGSNALSMSSNLLYEGTSELYEGMIALCDGSLDLSNGANTLQQETSTLEDDIDNEIDTLLDEITGDNSSISSFVSPENKEVNSVQFVIKTASITLEEAEVEVLEEKKELNIWQKFLQLFGFDF